MYKYIIFVLFTCIYILDIVGPPAERRQTAQETKDECKPPEVNS